MATNTYFSQGTTGEQDLTQSLVNEQIKMFGKDVYYIPRTLVCLLYTSDAADE